MGRAPRPASTAERQVDQGHQLKRLLQDELLRASLGTPRPGDLIQFLNLVGLSVRRWRDVRQPRYVLVSHRLVQAAFQPEPGSCASPGCVRDGDDAARHTLIGHIVA